MTVKKTNKSANGHHGTNGNGNDNGNTWNSGNNANNPDSQKEMLIRIIISLMLCFGTYVFTEPRKSSLQSSEPQEQFEQQLKQQEEQHQYDSLIRSDDVAFWNGPHLEQHPDDETNNPEYEYYPPIAWLASYPNSGTSFTMTTVEHMSNLSTASNYGDEVTAPNQYSLSIYPRHPEGPYWDGMSGRKGSIRKLPKPNQYILTKTHCGSRCVRCPPQQYKETYDSFLDACRNTTGRIPSNDPLPSSSSSSYYRRNNRQTFVYPPNRVRKLVHLIRNPYNNIVARFHLDYKAHLAKHDNTWLEQHPSDEKGFRRWCKDLDQEYHSDESKFFGHDPDFLKVLRACPCHGEFFRFVQWHNLVFEIAGKMKEPAEWLSPDAMKNDNVVDQNANLDIKDIVLVLHYEDYEQDFAGTMRRLLVFLEQPAMAEPREFSPGHQYDTYYTDEDRLHIESLVQTTASAETWNAIQHYFI